MIDALYLKNVQAHEDTLLEFTPGINAITGKSDNGKSTIVRALNYLNYNRPASNNYPSHWIKNNKGNLTGEMSIAVKKGSDSVIRYRNKDENGYIINGETLKAINRDVPEQVESILNLSEVNIQKQLDSHFLLSNTAGQIAQFFNELVNLEEIDEYLSEADSLKRKNNKEIKELTERISGLEAELKTYDWIERAEKLNKSLSIVEVDFQDIEAEIKLINDRSEAHRDVLKDLSELPDFEAVQTLINEFESLREPDYKSEINLSNSLTAYKSINILLEKLPDIDKAWEIINQIQAMPEPDYDELTELVEEHEEYNVISSDLTILLSGLEEAGETIGKIEKYNSRIADYYSDFQRASRAHAEYLRLVSDFDYVLEMLAEIEDKMPDACPLCGNTLEGGLEI